MFVQLPMDMVSPLLRKSCYLYLCLASTLERQKWHIAITDSDVTGQQHVAVVHLRTISVRYDQFTYLDKFYGERNRTLAHCTNRRYQVLTHF